MSKIDLNYYFQCGNCNTGTVVLGPKGSHIGKAVPGAVGGALLLGAVSFGLLAPVGAALGAGAAVGRGKYDHDSTCDTCGAVYGYAMAKKLHEKAIPKSGSTSGRQMNAQHVATSPNESRSASLPPSNAANVAVQLTRLAELRAAGVLTEDEFSRAKQRVLDASPNVERGQSDSSALPIYKSNIAAGNQYGANRVSPAGARVPIGALLVGVALFTGMIGFGFHPLWVLTVASAGLLWWRATPTGRAARAAYSAAASASPPPTNAPRAAEAYCVRCKSKRVMENATQITMKDGRPATGGECSVCGTKMFNRL